MSKRKNSPSPVPKLEDKEINVIKNEKRKKKEKKEIVLPEIPNKPNQCHFFVKRKSRYCNMTAKRNENYCGEHAMFQSVETNKRIPCPFDNNHTIFEKDLEKHAKKCNARPPDVQPEYYEKDLNIETQYRTIDNTRLANQDKDKINEFLGNLNNKAAELIGDISEEILDHSALDSQKELKTDIKHVAQQASLIGHIEKLKLLKGNNVFVEFGAGKGELSLYTSKALEDATKDENAEDRLNFILVDRNNFRLKYDRHLKGNLAEEKAAKKSERLMIDIKDLNLSKIESLKGREVVAYSKHLCGAATDLTLRCLKQFQNKGGKIAGIIIALCCHHGCNLTSYTGLEYLKDKGIIKSDDQVSWLSSISSWATCGLREKEDTMGTINKDNNNEHYSGLDHKTRETLGFHTKRLLDLGRLDFVKNQLGLDAKLVRYVDIKLSLENVALIATPKI